RDQFDSTAKIWKDLGHKVYYFNPWDLSRTMGFEPLFGATPTELRALVEGHIIISPDPRDTTSHYRVLEQQVLEAVFKALQIVGACHGPNGSPYCRYKTHDEFLTNEKKLDFGKRCFCRRHLCTLPAATDIISRGYYVIKALIQSFPAIYQYTPIVHEGKPSMQTIGMLNGLAGKMKYYLDPGPREAFSRADFCLDMITKPMAKSNPVSAILYIDSPAEQGRAASVLASVMAQLIYQKVNERREILKKQNVSGDQVKHLSLRFDEIGTFTIPDINNMMATIRDTNTGCVLLLQDKEQFNQFYQKGVGETIQTNSFARIYTGKIEQKRAEIISKSIGNKIVSEKSFSYGFEGIFIPSEFERKQSKKQAEVPILSPDKVEVMCSDELEKNETARKEKRKPNLDGLSIIVSAMRPFVVKKFPFFRTPKHKRYIDLVNESKEWVQLYSRLTEKQDARHEERPRGFYSPYEHSRIDRLNPNPISWEVVDAVQTIIQQNLSENDQYIAISLKQSGQLKAKARDLGYKDESEKTEFLDSKSNELFKKRFNGLTSADAEKLKKHLDELLEIKKKEEAQTKIEDKSAVNHPTDEQVDNF
ncbi:MAG TPA: type IV secretory system conjugative DNA transfer family protein, partial [Pyrinomonadaceae bacterium]|nr:type IV secretory system conjugative DNA transfer family protein [Pyrinomonadaceae bacterium]